ncbi:uncharacterized protein [Setaria viridis]|uniref:uncharacterized protein isoform X1 n=1 Tax=Setaria viridis TaxID=4556 RepID=UPI003B3A4D0E
MKGLLKGLRYISQIFDAKEPEMQIGNPTDVKHVAHIGWDNASVTAPSWVAASTPDRAMRVFVFRPSNGSDWECVADERIQGIARGGGQRQRAGALAGRWWRRGAARRRRSRRQGGAASADEGEGFGGRRGEAAGRRGGGVAAGPAAGEDGHGGRRRGGRRGAEAAAEEAPGVGGPVQVVVRRRRRLRHRLGLGGGAVGGGAGGGVRSRRLLRRRERLPRAAGARLVHTEERTPSNLNLAFVWLEVGELWAFSFNFSVLLLRLVPGRSFLWTDCLLDGRRVTTTNNKRGSRVSGTRKKADETNWPVYVYV